MKKPIIIKCILQNFIIIVYWFNKYLFLNGFNDYVIFRLFPYWNRLSEVNLNGMANPLLPRGNHVLFYLETLAIIKYILQMWEGTAKKIINSV